MKVLSLYCGAGGIDEGLKQAGINTTLAIDMDPDCYKTIKLNHPDCEVLCGKVGSYIESLGGFDIVVGGPPCPEFSRAKTDRTFDTCEVDIFWSIIERSKPKWHLMENVQDIIKVLKKRSFLVNCADYGVPQTRIRRFYTNLPVPKPSHAKTPTSDLFGNEIKRWISVKEALGLEGMIQDRKTTFGDGFRNYSIDEPNFTILSDGRVWYISSFGHSKQNRDKITRTIEEPADTVVVANEMRITNYEIKSLKKIRNRNPSWYDKHKPNNLNKPFCTVRSKDRNNADEMITDNDKLFARKLTNEELAILQGFPKDYKFSGNKTSVRRQIGNAVPPPVIKAFFTGYNFGI